MPPLLKDASFFQLVSDCSVSCVYPGDYSQGGEKAQILHFLMMNLLVWSTNMRFSDGGKFWEYHIPIFFFLSKGLNWQLFILLKISGVFVVFKIFFTISPFDFSQWKFCLPKLIHMSRKQKAGNFEVLSLWKALLWKCCESYMWIWNKTAEPFIYYSDK